MQYTHVKYKNSYTVSISLTQLLQINTLRTGDADLHFYITTVQDG